MSMEEYTTKEINRDAPGGYICWPNREVIHQSSQYAIYKTPYRGAFKQKRMVDAMNALFTRHNNSMICIGVWDGHGGYCTIETENV